MSATIGDAQNALSSTPYMFLQPTPALHTGFLQLAKRFLDPLANDITEAQLQRQKLARQDKKRKRGGQDGGSGEMLRMKKIHVDGFEVDQVWQQARRVLHAVNEEVERELPQDLDSEDDSDLEDDQPAKSVRFKDDGLEVGEDDEEMGEEGVDYEVEGVDTDEYDEDGANLNGGDDDEDPDDMDEEDYETPGSDIEENEARQEVFVKDPHGLNDGFFSIDQFNKTSQFMEQQDERGEDDGAASDEEDIDWGSNPFAIDAQPAQEASTKKQKPSRRQDSPEEDSEDEEGGPTFGNMDLDAPEGESGIDMDDDDAVDDDDMNMGGNDNANNIMYTDFFAPPATSKKAKSKKRSENEDGYKQRKQQKLATEGNVDAEEAALDRVMTAAQRDLLNEDASDNDDDVSLSPDEYDAAANDDPNAPPTRGNLSTHERRQLALRSEIRKLEAAAVASKPWYLTGESVAAARDENALLEEDLEFERAGKPVPVITEEISEDIEALIKRRILAREFDEIPRRRPGEVGTGAEATKRGKIPELSDQKSKQGLADEYEADLLARTDPNYVDTRTEALKAQHKAIEGLWAAVSSQLDALSNWHYKPKPAAASLEVRVDVSTVAMEDARPTAGGDVNTSTLAPQEVYKPGEDGGDGSEVVRTKGGNAVAREEMSKEQKVRRRRREKERQKKAGMNEGEAVKKSGNIIGDVAAGSKTGKSGKSRESQRDVEAQLKKGGAQIIDKKGALRDVEGNLVKGSRGAGSGVGALRL